MKSKRRIFLSRKKKQITMEKINIFDYFKIKIKAIEHNENNSSSILSLYLHNESLQSHQFLKVFYKRHLFK